MTLRLIYALKLRAQIRTVNMKINLTAPLCDRTNILNMALNADFERRYKMDMVQEFAVKGDMELIGEWHDAQKQLTFWKDKEAELRGEVVKRRFNDVSAGTRHSPLNNGWKLTAVFKDNYNLDRVKGGEAYDKIEAIDPTLADFLVKYKPELSISTYKTAPDWAKALIGDALTITPGTPSLELVAPKAK